MSTLLEVENVDIRFPLDRPLSQRVLMRGSAHIDAVIDASFTLESGQTLAIVGESGSGKTSLGRALNGLLPIANGSIRFDGVELADASRVTLRAARRQMAMVFQDPISSLSPRHTIGHLIAEPLSIQRSCPPASFRAEAERLLGLVGLPGAFADRYPHQLSGGQARRVGIARALCMSPRLIIADEPTAGLDLSVQGSIINLLTNLKRSLGLALILITHNLALVRHVSDRVAVMYMGRIVEFGSSGALLKQPTHPYTIALLAAQHRFAAGESSVRVRLTGEVGSLRDRPSGCEFHPRCHMAQPICSEQPPRVAKEAGRHYLCHFPIRDGGSGGGSH